MKTVEVLTDAGAGFVKAMGNPEGEHALACELIGSSLAESLGLPTLDFTLFEVAADPILYLDEDDALPFERRRRATPGPAFASKAVTAVTWDGTDGELERLSNPEVIAGLVLLDTWVANPDRHPRRPVDPSYSTWQRANHDNVLLEVQPRGRRRLMAMDFTVCLHCRGGGLRSRYDDRLVRDDGTYGLFPAFEPFVDEALVRPFLDHLRAPSLGQWVGDALGRIPKQWQVEAREREAVRQFLLSRAAYMVENFVVNLRRVVPTNHP